MVENRLYAYSDDSTLLAVDFKPADRPAVAASLVDRDLAGIQEWSNHWCMILNPNNTKALVINRTSTVNPPLGYLVLSGVPFALVLTSIFWDSRLTFKDHVRFIVSRVSQRICILMLVKHVFMVTSVLLRYYYICISSPNPGVLLSGVGVCC